MADGYLPSNLMELGKNCMNIDVLLIQDEEDPKCFTRTMADFTCFFETTDNGTYDFLYNIEGEPSKKCEMSMHGTENGTFRHVCSFPLMDFFAYVGMEVKVVDLTKNITLYKRTVHVEDLCLLDPPSIVSLQPGDTVGKMLFSLDTNLKRICNEKYRIHYSSKTLGEKTVEGKDRSFLLSLEPGEEVEVQASVKCENGLDAHPGYWSAWSKPARAIVPQSADDISLVCFTSDLQHVTCHWNSTKYAENDYKLFYTSSQPLNWTECQDDGNLSDTCSFHGDKSGAMKVKLSSTAAPLKRLFFSKEIELKKSIKSGSPSHLKGELINDKLCLEWEAPLPSLSDYMVYEVDVQIKAVEDFRITKQRNTSTCVRLSSEGQFSVKVRAKPDGSIYSGHWSDWSDVLSGTTTDNTDMQLVWCFYVSILVITIGFITTILLYRRKLKLFFWPPVPNLEKVLQGFLTDINQQKWDPAVTSKLYFEETTSSVVEIMSAELPKLNKPTEEFDFLSSDGSFSIEEHGSSGSETLRDYVTLNKDLSILCLEENCYVYEQFKDGKDPEKGEELYTTCCCLKPCSCNNYFNHSYLPLSQSTDSLSKNINVGKDESNPYTNLSLD
ncbi:thrombopoietin receptor isoform X2 [Gambusia affinis]|uniref:thrombopoietin receptor isoform X2 n=1 Tax=Gambusia affinis TaxID=33528 RepID=UPI001CDC893F|nr:thrombopoietin receptor isoform X2 [Gambusia affinis]XP_043985877.1 thrombopoietin receptor isoform X2 [Gambusia affinis]